MIKRGKALITISLLVASLPGQVFAVPISFYLSQTGIEAADPRAKDSVCQNSGTAGALTGKNNEEKIWNYLISTPLKDGETRLTAVQVAGIMGNIQQESSFSPTAESSVGAYGIIQWDDRRPLLEKRAKEVAAQRKISDYKKVLNDLQFQLEHIWWEMITGENPNNFEAEKFNQFYEETKSSNSPADAASSWEKRVERSAGRENIERRKYAQEIFNRHSTRTPSTGSGGATPGSCSSGGGSIVEIAVKELGTKEDPSGCDTAVNNSSVKGSCGPIDKYTDGHLEFWCADFVSWVYLQAGIPFTGGRAYDDPKTPAEKEAKGWRIAGTQPMQKWFAEKGKSDRTFVQRSNNMEVKAGDVYFLTENGGDDGIYHTGIVEKVEGTTLHVISGNTSSGNNGNGDVVGRDKITNYKENSILYGVGRRL